MRILFMGTPDIAAESLNALIAAGHDICAVFTRADKPVGRKQILTAPPVKQTAEANGIPVYQPRTLRDGSSDELIKSLAPDIIVVVAYGCIIPPQLLHVAKIWLHQPACLAVTQVPWFRPYPMGCAQRRCRNRRDYYAVGRRVGYRRYFVCAAGCD